MKNVGDVWQLYLKSEKYLISGAQPVQLVILIILYNLYTYTFNPNPTNYTGLYISNAKDPFKLELCHGDIIAKNLMQIKFMML